MSSSSTADICTAEEAEELAAVYPFGDYAVHEGCRCSGCDPDSRLDAIRDGDREPFDTFARF